MKASVFDTRSHEESLSNKIVVGLERVSEAFRVLLWNHAKEIGLSPIQIQILIFLKYHNEALRNVSYLAREFNMTKPTVSDAIKVLYEKDFIAKQKGRIDARSYTISLTQKGQKLAKEVESFANPMSGFVRDLNKEDQLAIFNGLSRLIHDLNRKGIISIQRMCFECQFYGENENGHYCHFIKEQLKEEQIRLDCDDFRELAI